MRGEANPGRRTGQLLPNHHLFLIPISVLYSDTLKIVDFVIWLLFRKEPPGQKPQNLLCQGLQRYMPTNGHDQDAAPVPEIPGVWSIFGNVQVAALKSHPWTGVTNLLGDKAEILMSDMLLHCGIFSPVADSSNFSQMAGTPLHELTALPISVAETPIGPHNPTKISSPAEAPTRSPSVGTSSIRFVRHRMFYARPATTPDKRVKFGLNPIHVLNRLRVTEDLQETHHVMKYMFPRQFHLHNVFTSTIDRKETAQHLKDYTIREQEISKHARLRRRGKPGEPHHARLPSLPKRLRGQIVELIHRTRVRHSRCPFSVLLNYYCPISSAHSASLDTTLQQATRPSQVASFCRAVIRKIFPSALFGDASVAAHNMKSLERYVDHFIRMRRHETMSLHDALQDIKLRGVPWLEPPHADSSNSLSKTDLAKRSELMAELIYYLFDSFLIPLIRAHFYVTESNVQRNQLFYFRHDVWSKISKPALISLKETVLEQHGMATTKAMATKRALGVSTVRLLPKAQGFRPIINLRRRVRISRNGTFLLGRSINSILTPAFSVLNCEKRRQQGILGSALFSVDDILPRLQRFRRCLSESGQDQRPLFLAKVDVQACFDSIPQKNLMRLVQRLITAEHYNIAKYSRAKLLGKDNQGVPGFGAKASWKYLTKAISGSGAFDFAAETADEARNGRERTVFVNGGMRGRETRRAILELIGEHVESNLIRVGDRVYRQKNGIPQGSILSSLLCSYFYAELERTVLDFITGSNSILLRLIDDFLIISTDQAIAERFITVMHNGVPEFGVKVKADKTRTNFAMSIHGNEISSIAPECEFPYCGIAINSVTLDLTRDNERRLKNSKPLYGSIS